MTTLTNSLFDSVILDQDNLRAAAPKTVRRPVTPMASSLWLHTLNESADHRRHGRMVRRFFALVAVLGAASVAFALWQTCNLMAGDTLHAAVQAIAH